MKPLKRVDIEVTSDNLWFLQRNLGVFDFLEIFPADAVGDNRDKGMPVRLRTDLGFDIETDINRAGLQLRNRSRYRGWVRWTEGQNLQPGDHIVIERTGERDYDLSVQRKSGNTGATNHDQV